MKIAQYFFLTGLMSFMLEDHWDAVGSIVESEKKRRSLAKQSWSFNLTNKHFCELFPDLAEVGPPFLCC